MFYQYHMIALIHISLLQTLLFHLPSISALDILETLIEFQPTLGKLYNTVGGLNTLVAKLLGAASDQLKQKLLKIINSLPSDG